MNKKYVREKDFWLKNNSSNLDKLRHIQEQRPEISDRELGKIFGTSAKAVKMARQRNKILKGKSSGNRNTDFSTQTTVDKFAQGLNIDVVLESKHGKKITLQEALENPKFKRLLESGKIDLSKYEISRFITNSWDVTNAEGETFTNHQFKIWWNLKVSNPLLISNKELEKTLLKFKPKKYKPIIYPKDTQKMVEISLYDIHFGMLSWKMETGEDYDLKLARNIYNNAIDQIIKRLEHEKIDYFLFPIGNDFLHINDTTNLTPRAKNRLVVDGRLAKVITEAEYMLVDSVNKLKQIAPVKLFWIPGNHDPETSYYLLRILNAKFDNDKYVEVDTSPAPRKYKLYGRNLIGFAHGMAMARQKNWMAVMADECAGIWKPNQYREVHTGHQHRESELIYKTTNTIGSMVLRVIPSMCGTDYWHFEKGFTATPKTALCFIWDKKYGLESIQDIHIRMDLYNNDRGKNVGKNK